MNRFRVWCKNNNEHEIHPVVLGNNGKLYHLSGRRLIELNPETHVIQWFVRKDSEGNDVYVGDRVKCFMDTGDWIEFTVVWHEAFYRFALQCVDKNYNVFGECFALYENLNIIKITE
jgi:uncharacterized protein YvpB